MFFVHRCVMIGLVVVPCFAFSLVAQESSSPAPAASTSAPESGAPESGADTQSFDELFARWKKTLGEMNELRVKYQNSVSDDEKNLIVEQFEEKVKQGHELEPKLIAAAEKRYRSAPGEDKDLEKFLVGVAGDYAGMDQYENAFRIGKLLLDNHAPHESLFLITGASAVALQKFDAADEYLKKAHEAGVISQPKQEDKSPRARLTVIAINYLSEAEQIRKDWAKEQEIRKKEAAADDLPRVKLETSEGDIVIELFENQAPNTVANFVSLVEKGFYDGLTFHRVLANFMAQGGDPEGTGTGGPGYNIACECYREDYRRHFRGTLSMAHAGKDTGGSQFFLTFLPTSMLDGRHTAFGRVIEGMDVLEKLTRIDPQNPRPDITPSKIVKATVLRKRPHEYAPKTMPER